MPSTHWSEFYRRTLIGQQQRHCPWGFQLKLIDLKHKQHVILSVLFPGIIDVWKILLMWKGLLSQYSGLTLVAEIDNASVAVIEV